jgi:integrase
LLKPDLAGRHPKWRARYTDPDSGRVVKTTLDPKALRTKEARRDWAIAKSKSLAKRRMELDAGAHRATRTAFDVATERYFEHHPQLRPRTLEIYRATAKKLQAWAPTVGVRSADDLTGPKLLAFRAKLIKDPKTVRAKGGKRGATKATKEPRSPSTINMELRAARTMLGYLRRLGLLSRVTSDDLKDGLQRLPMSHDRVEYIKPHELRKLLEAALQHDSKCFEETRAEHAGLLPRGATTRYQPIVHLVALVMLTGMRAGEARDLKWDRVDFEANEIRLRGEDTKTGKPRDIDMAVSDALKELVDAQHELTGSKERVFHGMTKELAKSTVRRLVRDFGAPAKWSWQRLRRTTGTFLTCSPSIFGAASAYMSARQLGHGVAVAERHYLGVIKNIPTTATTLEAAMQVEDHMQRVIDAVKARAATKERKSA